MLLILDQNDTNMSIFLFQFVDKFNYEVNPTYYFNPHAQLIIFTDVIRTQVRATKRVIKPRREKRKLCLHDVAHE